MSIRLASNSTIDKAIDRLSDLVSSQPQPVTFSATGGTISNVTISGTNYRVHTFTTSGTFTVTAGSTTTASALVVAGGGGGGGRCAGGGGAGGDRKSTR